jgi:hypothetical protein
VTLIAAPSLNGISFAPNAQENHEHVPAPVQWMGTVGTAVVWVALAPWMLTTTFRHNFGRYLLCSLASVGIIAEVDVVFR